MRPALFLLPVFTACSSSTPFVEESADPDAGQGVADVEADDSALDAGPNPTDSGSDAGLVITDSALASSPIAIPHEPQREGDPATGYDILVNEGYVGCGIPWSIYSVVNPWSVAPGAPQLPGRRGKNANLAYFVNAFTTTSTVEVVHPNCLHCHGAVLDGQIVVGLGNPNADFTQDLSNAAELAGFLVSDPNDRREWRKWADRVQATAPYIRTRVLGANPADNLAAALFAHRDPESLAWSNSSLIDPPPTDPAPVDVPPWWRMKHKNAMFYTASGRGDHARIMMTASTLCVDSEEDARKIDSYFHHVRAFIASIQPPAYPYPVEQNLAAEGRETYLVTCERCHGDPADEAGYPNLVIPLDEIGTDPALAGSAQFADRFVDWFNQSFYGETARFEPERGYVAPPLDGIWATPPFFHNGSVPNLEGVLDSSARPTYWTRDFTKIEIDQTALGFVFTELDHGQDAETSGASRIRNFDTTLPGYGNGGHTYGDDLTSRERSAVIEYLKTL